MQESIFPSWTPTIVSDYLSRFDLSWLLNLFSVAVLYQMLAIIAAMVLALGISYTFGSRIKALSVSIRQKSDHWTQRILSFCLDLAYAVLFSLSAAVLLSLCVTALQDTGLISEQGQLIFVRVAYQIFYAWALLRVLIRLLQVSLKNKQIGTGFKKAVYLTFWTLAALEILGILPGIVEAMKSYTLPVGSGQLTLWKLFVGVITVIVTMGLANKLADVCEHSIMKMDELEMNLRVVFARISRVSLLIVALLLALSSVGIDLTVLSVFSGAIGVGIGFGMQKIASNYISGFIILFDRSVKLGDYVQVAGFSGVITQINTRYSVIRNTAGQELIVPNENFVTGTVTNYSLSERESAITLDVSCAYESNIDRALEIFATAIKEQPRVLKTREPWVVVSELAASGVVLKAGFWVMNPENGTAGLKSNILREVMKRFAAEGIEIPYDKLEVTVKNAAAFRSGDSQYLKSQAS